MRIIARMNIGGPAVQVTGLMRGLNPSKFDHRLYTGFCATHEADYLENVATDINATRLESLGRSISIIHDIKAFLQLVKEIKRFKPHIIHTHTTKAGVLGRIASVVSLHSAIRVHTFHGHLLNGYFNSFKTSLLILVERVLSLFTHHLLAVGGKIREDLIEVGIGNPNKFGLMPPGLALGNLPPKLESQKFLGLNPERLQCAFIGRVTNIKRPDRFLDLVKEVKLRGIDLDFFIAGDGEQLSYCRERITQEELPVKMLGWQSEIERVLVSADILVLTSDNEGTPLSLIQAGMAGLPVVSTSVGSVPEIVLDGVTGIITTLSVKDLADAIEKLFYDKSLRTNLGASGQKFTLENFSLNRLVHDHEELYKVLHSNLASF